MVGRDPAAADALSEDFGGMFTTGVPIDQDTLKHAGIEGCDVVVAVTKDDNTNLMVAQIARDLFGVPKVISRVSDPRREEVFSSFGLSTVCPTILTAASIAGMLEDEGGHKEQITFGGTKVIFEEMPIDRQYIGEYAEAIELPKGNVLLGVLSQGGKLRLRGEGMQTVIREGDSLIVSHIMA